MAEYRVCGKCGARVDPGEECRCVEERRLEIEARRSGTGRFFLYNSGGRHSIDTIGRAQVLAGEQGEPLKCYKRIREVNGAHGLFRVTVGCHVIQVKEFRFGFPEISIYRINGFEQRGDKYVAVCWKLYRETYGSREFWDTPVDTVEMLWKAVDSAVGMAETVMCIKPCYVKMEGV